MITEVPGVRVGHWTDAWPGPVARSCCCRPARWLPVRSAAPRRAPGSGRCSSPGGVDRVNAVVLTGGSAFGLAACDGVVRWCEERGIGYPTSAGPVPIVVGMVLFDLGVGDPPCGPGPPRATRPACGAAGRGRRSAPGGRRRNRGHHRQVARARTGPGPAASDRRVAPPRRTGRGGPAGGQRRGRASARRCRPVQPRLRPFPCRSMPLATEGLQATTIGVVVTNARLDKVALPAGRAIRSRRPGPGPGPGAYRRRRRRPGGGRDRGGGGASVEMVRALAAWVVEQAVADAVGVGM